MGDDAAPDVTIATVTWNSEPLLSDCLASLPAGLQGVASSELIVVDNASTDATVQLARRLSPGATVIEMGRNAGYSAGVNAAVEASRSRAGVLIINPDVRLAPGAVAPLLRAVEAGQSERVGIAVPRLVDGSGQLAYSLRREPTALRAWGEALLGGLRAGRVGHLGMMVIDPRAYDVPGTYEWASGAAMLISHRCLEAVGPWDQSFFLYDEEIDFCLRARDAGFVLQYVPDSMTVHLGGDSHRSPRLWSMCMVNDLRLFRRRNRPLKSASFYGALVVGEALRAALGREVHRAGLAALLLPSRRPTELRR
ncbi:MAG: glycosyltransferase family 2 protein [Acidimicrobiales bacterium]